MSREDFLSQHIDHGTRDDLAINRGRNAHGKDRDAVKEVDRAVEWVDDPLQASRRRVAPALEALRSHSSSRIAKNPDFSELKAEIERGRKMRAEKTVSLNEAQRQKEKDDLKARSETAKKDRLARAVTSPPAYEVTVKNASNPGLGEIYKPKPPVAELDPDSGEVEATNPVSDEDIILREAQNILLDYSSLLNGQPIVSQR